VAHVSRPADFPALAADDKDAPAGPVLIAAQRLSKRFGELMAVDAVDFEVRRGEAFGFLGPNGAGKSSTMRMIGCVSPVSSGTLRILGLDPSQDGARIRARLGVVPQQDTLDPELTVRENLYIYGRYFGLPRQLLRPKVDELLEFASLTERANAKVEPLSGGMKRRLTIARSLINDPEILLLDEPTTGLDPQARHVLWDRLYRLKSSGVTLVLTTHYMDEAEQLCDRLVVMDGGRIVAEGSPAQLIAEHSTREVAELRFAADDDGAVGRLAGVIAGNGERVEALPDRVLLYVADGEQAVARAHAAGLRPVSTLVRRSTLEDVFLRLTGRSLID
jgi:lipooligosaccharide transport system ATP-binding protein